MNKEQLEQKLEEMAGTIYGKAMIAYLQEIINEIDTIRDAPTLQEVRGREIACKKMEKIINRLQPQESKEMQSEYE
jgi:hypothetical protein